MSCLRPVSDNKLYQIFDPPPPDISCCIGLLTYYGGVFRRFRWNKIRRESTGTIAVITLNRLEPNPRSTLVPGPFHALVERATHW